jgi:hypothetical protein
MVQDHQYPLQATPFSHCLEVEVAFLPSKFPYPPLTSVARPTDLVQVSLLMITWIIAIAFFCVLFASSSCC